MANKMLPKYSTELFCDIWDELSKFQEDFTNSPFTGSITADNVSKVYYLLYARYGNNPIANYDINQWKYKIFSVIFQYGPTWEKRLDIQKKIRDLTETELLTRSKAIHNHALNPSTAPSTSSLDELTYINDQQTSQFRKNKLDAYGIQLSLLKTDVTEEFLDKFKKCFKIFVSSERPLLYVTDIDEDEIEEEE